MGTVKFQIVGDGDKQTVEEIHRVVVHQFILTDVEDPDIYAAEPMWEWQQTDAGKFVMENVKQKPEFHIHVDNVILGYRCIIIAELEKKKLVEYYLKFGKIK